MTLLIKIPMGDKNLMASLLLQILNRLHAGDPRWELKDRRGKAVGKVWIDPD